MRNRNQLVLPLNLEIKIGKNDPVRKLVEICDNLDYTNLYNTYLRNWRKIDPVTLFEILVFANYGWDMFKPKNRKRLQK